MKLTFEFVDSRSDLLWSVVNFAIKFAFEILDLDHSQREWDRAQMKKLEEIRSGLCI